MGTNQSRRAYRDAACCALARFQDHWPTMNCVLQSSAESLLVLGLATLAIAAGRVLQKRRGQRSLAIAPPALLAMVTFDRNRLRLRYRTMPSYADIKGGDTPYVPPHNGTDTSKAAAASVRKTVDKQAQTVLTLIRTAGARGHTTDEVEEITGGIHQAISARVHDLAKAGLIYCNVDDATDRRLTRTGRKARIYRAVEFRPAA